MESTIDLTSLDIDHLEELPDFQALTEWTKGCTACGLRESATEPVHYDGDPASPVMLVGINPGFCEDGSQIPFAGRAEIARSRCVGCHHFEECYEWQTGQGTALRPRVERCQGFVPRASAAPVLPPAVLAGKLRLSGIRSAGQILDDLLDALGIDRSKLFITNAALCKSTANSTPRPQEYNRCASIRIATQRLVRPKVIVTLGNDPTRQYSGRKLIMKTAHGVPLAGTDSVISYTIVPTYHPSYILRMMLDTGRADLTQFEALKLAVRDAKWAMFSDLTTAFNLLEPDELAGLMKDPSKLIDGKLPVKGKT